MPESKPSVLTRPGLSHVPYVVIKRPDGSLALRHPDELKSLPGQAPQK
jgi:hypothetical protein